MGKIDEKIVLNFYLYEIEKDNIEFLKIIVNGYTSIII